MKDKDIDNFSITDKTSDESLNDVPQRHTNPFIIKV